VCGVVPLKLYICYYVERKLQTEDRKDGRVVICDGRVVYRISLTRLRRSRCPCHRRSIWAHLSFSPH